MAHIWGYIKMVYIRTFNELEPLLMGFSWIEFLVSLFGMHMFCILMPLFGGSLCLMKVTRCWIWRFWAFWIFTAPLSPDFKAPNINPPNRSNSPHQDGPDDDGDGSSGGGGAGPEYGAAQIFLKSYFKWFSKSLAILEIFLNNLKHN